MFSGCGENDHPCITQCHGGSRSLGFRTHTHKRQASETQHNSGRMGSENHTRPSLDLGKLGPGRGRWAEDDCIACRMLGFAVRAIGTLGVTSRMRNTTS